jgi:phosphoribosylglycinamide formyltransferase-1
MAEQAAQASWMNPAADVAWDGEPLALGVLASGQGTNFEALARAIARNELKAELKVLIYNNPDAAVAQRAARLGVPAVLHNHRDFASRDQLDAAIVATLKQYTVDWVAMAGWMRIVTPVLLEAFPERVINLHPSLLPSFKGVRAIEQALAAGVRISGCTAHLVIPELDSGPILAQAAVPVFPEDTPASLHERIQQQEHRIFPRAVMLAALRQLQSEAGSPRVMSRGTSSCPAALGKVG